MACSMAEFETRRGELLTRREELRKQLDAKKDRDGRYTHSEGETAELRARNNELDELEDRMRSDFEPIFLERRNQERMRHLRDLGPEPEVESRGDRAVAGRPRFAGRRGDGKGFKSVGAQYTESAPYKAWTERKGLGYQHACGEGLELKTLFQTSAGWDPEDTRTGRVQEFALQKPTVRDLLFQGQTQQSTVLYMEETTHTNNAAEVAEGGTYGEGAFAYTERSSEVRKIGVWIPATDEQFEDAPRVASLIDGRLMVMLENRLDAQILTGNGTAPNLRGINNVVGINTQARGVDPVPDALYKGMVLCQTVGFADPDAVIMHPLDWQDVALLRTADGVYIWGSPSEDRPKRIWGLPVVATTRQTQNTAVTGAFREQGELVARRGVEVMRSKEHSTFFIEGKEAVRADLRAALIWYRAAAFCTVTGI